jgi:hypothetical protein
MFDFIEMKAANPGGRDEEGGADEETSPLRKDEEQDENPSQVKQLS